MIAVSHRFNQGGVMAAIQHIGFNCKDRKVTEDFYRKHFGFERARVFNPGSDAEFVMLRRGPVCIELFDAADSSPTAGEQTVGFKHMAFEVAELYQAREALLADGYDMGEIIDCDDVSPGMRVCFFPDPDGNVLELMENWADEEDPPQE
jgi:glyoxylase I family protein